MIVALAVLLICTCMVLIDAILSSVERRLERRDRGVPPSGPECKNN
jgi:hypothetical protein